MESVRYANGRAAYLEKVTGVHDRRWLTHRGYLLLDETQQSYWGDEL